METNRQKKIAGVLQKDLVDILQNSMRDNMKGVVISVTKVQVPTDLSQAKVYLSIFPTNNRDAILKAIIASTPSIKKELAHRTKHQLRRLPEPTFFIDDSLDYIENIDAALRGEDENPIKNPEILNKNKKH
jgi:ribosome-binding factor A